MSLEHSPARFTGSPLKTGPPLDSDYWQALIDEKAAAKFLDLSARTLQGLRYRGGGPRFVRISARCVKYRRLDCRDFAVQRLRSSTSDAGSEAAS